MGFTRIPIRLRCVYTMMWLWLVWMQLRVQQMIAGSNTTTAQTLLTMEFRAAWITMIRLVQILWPTTLRGILLAYALDLISSLTMPMALPLSAGAKTLAASLHG